jgi:transposase
MSAYSLDFRGKIVESVNKGVPKAETARRFGVDRATVKRYRKQLDERDTLEPRKAPGKKPKLDEKAIKLLLGDLEARPWATHSQRAEFLIAVSGVSVSEATVCRAARRLHRSRKKNQRSSRTRRVLESNLAHGGLPHRSRALGVLKDEMGTHTSLAPVYAYAPVGERAFFEIPRNRGMNTTLLASLHQGGMGPSMAVEGATTARIFETRSAPAKEGKGAHRGEGLRADLPAVLLPGP